MSEQQREESTLKPGPWLDKYLKMLLQKRAELHFTLPKLLIVYKRYVLFFFFTLI